MGYMIVIHCGVVGNIQASHVCAPGSIPGDGAFFLKREGGSRGQEREGKRARVDRKRGGAVVARQAHNLQVG